MTKKYDCQVDLQDDTKLLGIFTFYNPHSSFYMSAKIL